LAGMTLELVRELQGHHTSRALKEIALALRPSPSPTVEVNKVA